MMGDKDLLPCPFCGGEAEFAEGDYTCWEEGYAVRCRNCSLTFGATGRLGEPYQWSCAYRTEAEAADAWNTRTPVLTGPGTCELVTSGTPCEGNADVECTRCGAYNIPQGGYYDHGGRRREAFAHCPNCGAEVRKAVGA